MLPSLFPVSKSQIPLILFSIFFSFLQFPNLNLASSLLFLNLGCGAAAHRAQMEDEHPGRRALWLCRNDSRLRRAVSHSHSSRMLLQSSVSSECAHAARYERLWRSPDQLHGSKPRLGTWRLLTNTFSRKVGELPRSAAAPNISAAAVQAAEESKKDKTGKKKNRWSSWLPDPQRRWPIQGW